MLQPWYSIVAPKSGDFYVDNNYVFEIGGRNKWFGQIAHAKNHFLALDDLESGIDKKIPLWLFGFLY